MCGRHEMDYPARHQRGRGVCMIGNHMLERVVRLVLMNGPVVVMMVSTLLPVESRMRDVGVAIDAQAAARETHGLEQRGEQDNEEDEVTAHRDRECTRRRTKPRCTNLIRFGFVTFAGFDAAGKPGTPAGDSRPGAGFAIQRQ
jgi:hypothetical protein